MLVYRDESMIMLFGGQLMRSMAELPKEWKFLLNLTCNELNDLLYSKPWQFVE